MVHDDWRQPFRKKGWKFWNAAFVIGLFLSLPCFTASVSAENENQAGAIQSKAARAGGDSLVIPSVFVIPPDSIKSFIPKEINPKKAMLKSLMIPGGGQLANGSRKKAFLFIATELVCLGGVIYETHLLGGEDLSDLDKEFIRTDRNTFILVWLGAKLFGMVDAYVDAQFKHFTVGDVTPPGMTNPDAVPAGK